MKISNILDLPESIVKKVSTEKHNKSGCLSATTMINGMKNIILTDRHWDSLEEDVSDRIWALLGTVGHEVLKDEGEHEFAEEFISYEVDGVTVTGRPDNYNMKTETISDYKFITIYKVKNKDFEDWRKQGLIYAWLMRKNGFTVKTCRFIAIIRDHSKREAKHNPLYPKTPIYFYTFDVTDQDMEEIELFIRDKVAQYKQFKDLPDNEIPPCTEKERWATETTYAVMKKNRVRAVRVYTNMKQAQEAVDEGAGDYVETRQGESKKCLDYCACCDLCNFYQSQNIQASAQVPVQDKNLEEAA